MTVVGKKISSADFTFWWLKLTWDRFLIKTRAIGLRWNSSAKKFWSRNCRHISNWGWRQMGHISLWWDWEIGPIGNKVESLRKKFFLSLFWQKKYFFGGKNTSIFKHAGLKTTIFTQNLLSRIIFNCGREKQFINHRTVFSRTRIVKFFGCNQSPEMSFSCFRKPDFKNFKSCF